MFIDISTLVMTDKEIQHNRKTILVVDDSLNARSMVRFALRGVDCEIMEAVDGIEAVKILHNQPIDLVVTDLNIPNLNGFELSRIVRETSGIEDIPIIMLAQDGSLEQKNEARKNGISLFMSKPFAPEHLFGLVKQVLR